MTRTVLLVEDNPDTQDVLSRHLREANADIRVRVCADAHAAFEAIDGTPPPDVVVADLFLPGVDGDRVYQEATKLNIPSVLISGIATRWARSVNFIPKDNVGAIVAWVGSTLNPQRAAC